MYKTIIKFMYFLKLLKLLFSFKDKNNLQIF